MNLNSLKTMAQQQLQDPKRRAQVEKLMTTAKTKIAERRPGAKPATDATPGTPVGPVTPVTVVTPTSDTPTV